MRTLHLAALPFPTRQGTQALLHAMLSALADAGHETHLLCYPQSGFERTAPYMVHRARGRPLDLSLRSGPSLRKVAEDVRLARELPALVRRLKPDRIFAHHVEAALCCAAARLTSFSYVAHTSVEAELGCYFPAVSHLPWAPLGAVVDQLASAGAREHLAISPRLCLDLSARTQRKFRLVSPPWFEQRAISEAERTKARSELGLELDAQVLLYAGNLDGYQGLDMLCSGLEHALPDLPRAMFLLATASEPSQLVASLPPLLSSRTRLVLLDSEEVRRSVHAAADVALVPRSAPGGLPVKLLDALSLGVPVLCASRATAGFEFGDVCRLVSDDDPEAWSSAIRRHFDLSREHRTAFSDAARAHVASAHGPAVFVRDLLASNR